MLIHQFPLFQTMPFTINKRYQYAVWKRNLIKDYEGGTKNKGAKKKKDDKA